MIARLGQATETRWTVNNTTTEVHLCIEADGRVAVAPVKGPAANDIGARSKY